MRERNIFQKKNNFFGEMQGENYFLFIVTELILDPQKKNGRKNNEN